MAEGQIITPAALTTARAGTTRGRVVAPLRLADADLVELLRPGDQVDVIAADPQSEQADVVARAVRVVTVPRADDPTAELRVHGRHADPDRGRSGDREGAGASGRLGHLDRHLAVVRRC